MPALYVFGFLALAFYGLSRVKFVYVVRRTAPRARSLAGAATAGRCVKGPASGQARKSTPASDIPRVTVMESYEQRSKRDALVSGLVNLGCVKATARAIAQKLCEAHPEKALNDLLWMAMREAA